jgi:hypothetical protein
VTASTSPRLYRGADHLGTVLAGGVLRARRSSAFAQPSPMRRRSQLLPTP